MYLFCLYNDVKKGFFILIMILIATIIEKWPQLLMPWFLVSPRYWHPWYCLFKVGVNCFMRRSILIILAVSSLKSDKKCTCICALQNEINTHTLELYNNNGFMLTIGIFRMNKLRLHILNFFIYIYLYISWKVYTIFQCTEITQGDKCFSW